MAENKKSFVAYSDWNGMFKALPNEVAGELIKHIFAYVNDENPKTDNYVINALFEQIKATLKRDLQKWESKREQRSEAGKASARKRAEEKEQESTTVETRSTKTNDRERKPTVSDSVSVSVSEINSINTIYTKKEFLEDWNEIRTKHLKKPSFLNTLNPEETEHLRNLAKDYDQEQIREALIGLFKQKNFPNGNTQMISNPKHFLTHFNTYLSAYHDRNTALYGTKQLEKTL